MGNPIQKRYKDVTYYEVDRGGDRFLILPLLGHLISVDFPKREKWSYPDIPSLKDLKWRVMPGRGKFLELLKRATQRAESVIVATDLDTEGSSIALESLEKIKWSISKTTRMEFSATTEEALLKAFNNQKSFDYSRAMAGRTRAITDLYYGYNTTRGITLAARGAGMRVKVFSAGRVQTPCLVKLAEKEAEISVFTPQKYFEIVGTFEKDGQLFEAVYWNPEIWEQTRLKSRERAGGIVNKCKKTRQGEVEASKKTVEKRPPAPFNMSTLQREAETLFGLSPAKVGDRRQGIAQRLYEQGLVSYPGTESQKYKGFSTRDLKSMLEKIAGYQPTSKDTAWVISITNWSPEEGQKSDPAHPCLHVTGTAEELLDQESKVYELIARRNLASLSPPSIEDHLEIRILMGEHQFRTVGRALVDVGWRRVYPYRPFEAKELPPLETGDEVRLVDIRVDEKETQPPKRYTMSSAIEMMVKLGIGTKNTRHAVLETLYAREYIAGRKVISVTAVGMAVASALKNNIPIISSPDMTAELENNMEEIEIGKLDYHKVLNESLHNLKKAMIEFKSKEAQIGVEIASDIAKSPPTSEQATEAKNSFGPCPACKEGHLRVVVSPKTHKKFVGCSRYPACRQSFGLPQNGKLIVLKNPHKCGLRPILVKRGQTSFLVCLQCGFLKRKNDTQGPG